MVTKLTKLSFVFVYLMFIEWSFVQAQELQMSVKIRLWDPEHPVCILRADPSVEISELPLSYSPPSIKELYRLDINEFDLKTLISVPNHIKPKIFTNDNIQFTVTYGDDPNEGFNDPNLGAARRNAFEFAMQIWVNLLRVPVLRHTATITILATWTPYDATKNVLASAGPTVFFSNFENVPIQNVMYPKSLTEIISGNDPSLGHFDMAVDFNSTSTNWYYGTDGNPGTMNDFVTVTLHELCHGLGFVDSFDSLGTFGEGAFEWPTIFDYHLVENAGVKLIDLPQSPDNLIGNNVFWNGLKGRFVFNADFGSPGNVPLFAPTPFKPGSSIAHLDDFTFSGEWSLMRSALTIPIHQPDLITLGMLQDMGYSLSNSLYVEANASGFQDGSRANPFDSIGKAMNYIQDGNILRMLPGNYNEVFQINRPMQLRGCGGTAIIGE